MAPPRRKSCAACIRSKRRCDLRFPTCQRCADREIPCDYGPAGLSHLQRTMYHQQMALGSSAWSGIVYSQPSPFASTPLPSTHETVAETIPLPPELMDTGGTSFNAADPSFLPHLVPDDSAGSNGVHPVNSKPSEDEPFREVFEDRSGKLVVFAPHVRGDRYHVLTIGSIWNHRISFLVERLKRVPSQFVHSVQTPFTHRAMYEGPGLPTPQLILDALSACSFYESRTDENQQFAFRDIMLKAGEVAASAVMPYTTSMELLASVQALILYQIIMLFDGDIRMRAEAEKLDKLTLELCDQLIQRADKATTIQISTSEMNRGFPASSGAVPSGAAPSVPSAPSAPSAPAPSTSSEPTPEKSTMADHGTTHSSGLIDMEFTLRPDPASYRWLNWTFHESCRRTILAAYLLLGSYEFVKTGRAYTPRRIVDGTFTASAALWEAPSEYHWRAATTKPQWPVRIDDWDEVMVASQAADLDELGVWMMVIRKGMRFTMDWLGKDMLGRYNLQWGVSDELSDS